MCRTATLFVALAALAVASAYGRPASVAKPHRRASGAQTHRSSPGSGAAHHTATTRTSARNAHRPSPEEVGRAAGLRIRRQLDRRGVDRRGVDRRELDRRATYRRRPARIEPYRRAQLVETAHVTRYGTGRPEPTPVAGYEDQPQTAVPMPAVRSYVDAAESTDIERSSASRQPVADAGADAAGEAAPGELAMNDQPSTAAPVLRQPHLPLSRTAPVTPGRTTPLPAANALPEAVESPSDTADEPAVEPPASVRSESDVASLAIPRGVMPAPLKGSLASLERQNDRLTAEGLERIENEDDLAARIANHLLVPVPASDALTVNPSLPTNHRYCRPWTAHFLADLAREHEAVFHRPLEVSSAVRTVEYQRHLMLINGNAAPAEGDVVSPHLTGATIDIAKEGLTRDEIKWMRWRLLQLEDQGKIDVEEEFQQSCFHITVYTTYAPPRTRRRPVHPAQPPVEADGSNTEGL